MEQRLHTVERYLITAFFGFSALFVIGLIAVKWPSYWSYIASEITPMTWWESLVLFACCLAALLCCALVFTKDGYRPSVALWGLLAAAFFFLTLDERFALHERIRDRLLAPRDIKLLPWVGPGDFLLLLYAVGGLLFLRYLLKEFAQRKAALRWFLAGAGLAALAVLMDSYDVSKMSLDAERLEQTVEEVFELSAMLAFLSSLTLMASHYLRTFLNNKHK